MLFSNACSLAMVSPNAERPRFIPDKSLMMPSNSSANRLICLSIMSSCFMYPIPSPHHPFSGITCLLSPAPADMARDRQTSYQLLYAGMSDLIADVLFFPTSLKPEVKSTHVPFRVPPECEMLTGI